MDKVRKEDVVFRNFNTDFVKNILQEKESEITAGMNDDQLEAYRFGVDAVLDFMNQYFESELSENMDKILFYQSGELTEYVYDEIFEAEDEE